jgi:thiol-disulfide isomerase/thioredoxin
VWATWCGPCIIEFPELVEINRMYRNRDFETVTVSADDLDQAPTVLSFLKREQASMRNLHFQESDPYQMIDALDPEWSGALPHTILLAPGGRVLYRAEGALEGLKLKRAIVDWLGRYYHSKPGGMAR